MSGDQSMIEVLFAGDDPPEGPTPADLAADDRFSVSQYRDFVAARDHADGSAADCVVVAHSEAGFDGLAFLEAVRKTSPELPVVLVAAVDAEVARRAIAADATALLPATEREAADTLAETIVSHAETTDDRHDRNDRMPISDLPVEAERRLKERALDEAPIGITIADATAPDTPSIYVNDAFGEIMGYPPADVVGVNLRFLQGPDTDPDRVARLADGIDDERETSVVLRNYRRDGTMFWNQVQISPLYDETGDVSHYVGFQMDVTERERAQRQLEAERESLDRLLDRVQRLVGDATALLVRADGRAEIERLLTERVGDGDEYATAWLGRYDPTEQRLTITQHAGDHDAAVDASQHGGGHETDVDASQGGGDDPEAAVIDLDAETPCDGALQDAVENQHPRVVSGGDAMLDIAADEVCVLVPLYYRSTTYGVLGVVERAADFDDRERVLLGAVGRSVGTAINYTLTKRTITTDTLLRIGVELFDDGLVLSRLAADLDTTFDHEAIISNDRDRGVLVLVSTPYDDADELAARAAADDDVLAADPLVDADDETVVQLRLLDSPLVDVLSEFGSRVTSLQATANRLSLEFCVGTENAAQSVLDELRATYDRVDLTAYHEDDPQQTPSGFREELRTRLTERQLTALKKAYVSGYFEWPRRVEGTELADSMGIVPSTYHQHLQAAKQKLVAAFFEDEP